MRRRFLIVGFIVAAGMLAALTPALCAEAEWEILKSLNIGSRPQDVAVSADGKSLFVLTEEGQILVYGADGTLAGTLAVGAQAERIAVDPEGERVYVTNRRNKAVDVILVDLIREIKAAGAPAHGRENAPVVIAVFSDFQ